MSSQSSAELQEGAILAGKYRVERVLGVGGMGVVVAARHMQLDTKVAIKYLAPAALENPDVVARFAREARAAVKITGEYVAKVLDVGTLESGTPYLVMEYLDGADLGAWLEKSGALQIEQAVEFVLQACVAVAEAHSLGIVHRDLKPANLFCVRRADGKPAIKVLDFGISKFTDAAESSLSVTRTAMVMGSPLYMSPEQMQASKSVDARADIWALGVILYELLTERVPFEGESITDVAVKVATQPVTPVRTLRAEVPAGLDTAILRCLAKPRDERFATVAELALALHDFAPPQARPLVERICDILRVSPPPSSTFVVRETVTASVSTPAATAATMAAVASTGGQPRVGGRATTLAVAATLAAAMALGLVAFLRSKAPADTNAAAMAPSMSASVLPPPPSPVAVSSNPDAVVEPPMSASAPAATPPLVTSAVTSAGKAPGRSQTPRSVLAKPPPAPATAASPGDAPRTPRKNPIDLGGFQ